jgi:hypothetical protein
MAPDSLSTSYLTGSEWAGISMITLISSGSFLPAGTAFKLIGIVLIVNFENGVINKTGGMCEL